MRRARIAADADVFDLRGHFLRDDIGNQCFARAELVAGVQAGDVEVGLVVELGRDRGSIQAVLEDGVVFASKSFGQTVDTASGHDACRNGECGVAVFCEHELDGRIGIDFVDGEDAFLGIGAELDRHGLVVIGDEDFVLGEDGIGFGAAEYDHVVFLIGRNAGAFVADDVFAVVFVVDKDIGALTAEEFVDDGFVERSRAAVEDVRAVGIAAGVEFVLEIVAEQSDVHGIADDFGFVVGSRYFVVDLLEVDRLDGVEVLIAVEIDCNIAFIAFVGMHANRCSRARIVTDRVIVRAVRESEDCLVAADIRRFLRCLVFDVDRRLLGIVAEPLRQEMTVNRRLQGCAVVSDEHQIKLLARAVLDRDGGLIEREHRIRLFVVEFDIGVAVIDPDEALDVRRRLDDDPVVFVIIVNDILLRFCGRFEVEVIGRAVERRAVEVIRRGAAFESGGEGGRRIAVGVFRREESFDLRSGEDVLDGGVAFEHEFRHGTVHGRRVDDGEFRAVIGRLDRRGRLRMIRCLVILGGFDRIAEEIRTARVCAGVSCIRLDAGFFAEIESDRFRNRIDADDLVIVIDDEDRLVVGVFGDFDRAERLAPVVDNAVERDRQRFARLLGERDRLRGAVETGNLDEVAAGDAAEAGDFILAAAFDAVEVIDEGIGTRAADENVRARAADELRTARAGFIGAAD